MPLTASAGYDVPPPMTHREDQFEEDDEADVGDREDPDESDTDDDDEPELIDCPYCGKEIYEQAEVCPHCGSYISSEDPERPVRRPRWLVVGVVVALIVVVIWTLTYV